MYKLSPQNANKAKIDIFKKSSLIRANRFFKDLEAFKLRGKPKIFLIVLKTQNDIDCLSKRKGFTKTEKIKIKVAS